MADLYEDKKKKEKERLVVSAPPASGGIMQGLRSLSDKVPGAAYIKDIPRQAESALVAAGGAPHNKNLTGSGAALGQTVRSVAGIPLAMGSDIYDYAKGVVTSAPAKRLVGGVGDFGSQLATGRPMTNSFVTPPKVTNSPASKPAPQYAPGATDVPQASNVPPIAGIRPAGTGVIKDEQSGEVFSISGAPGNSEHQIGARDRREFNELDFNKGIQRESNVAAPDIRAIDPSSFGSLYVSGLGQKADIAKLRAVTDANTVENLKESGLRQDILQARGQDMQYEQGKNQSIGQGLENRVKGIAIANAEQEQSLIAQYNSPDATPKSKSKILEQLRVLRDTKAETPFRKYDPGTPAIGGQGGTIEGVVEQLSDGTYIKRPVVPQPGEDPYEYTTINGKTYRRFKQGAK